MNNKMEVAKGRKIVFKGRRQFIKSLGFASIALPCAYSLDGCTATGGKAKSTVKDKLLIRDFHDPYLEVVRLLREVAEIEHSLMLQYLYASFSLKPQYQAVAGYGAPGHNDLLGVAIQEMQHLSIVNQLLVHLGALPCMTRQDFPYEPDIYPCEFSLEPITPNALAKYVYAEAPEHIFTSQDKEDIDFVSAVTSHLHGVHKGNHVGSVYKILLKQLDELASSDPALLPDPDRWKDKLIFVMEEGESQHYNFFKKLFMGEHEGFGEQKNVWGLDAGHKDYPSYTLEPDLSAYVGHDRQILDPTLRDLAWLGNLQYWACLMLLDSFYRTGKDEYKTTALSLMMGPILSLGRYMPKHGVGLPFDVLSAGSSPVLASSNDFVAKLLHESNTLSKKLKASLPGDYPLDVEVAMIKAIRTIA